MNDGDDLRHEENQDNVHPQEAAKVPRWGVDGPGIEEQKQCARQKKSETRQRRRGPDTSANKCIAASLKRSGHQKDQKGNKPVHLSHHHIPFWRTLK